MLTNRWTVIGCFVLMAVTNVSFGQTDESRFIELRDVYLAKYKPLVIQSETAWWDANTTGSDEAFERKKQAQNALVELHNDQQTFARLKTLKKTHNIVDPILNRELDVM